MGDLQDGGGVRCGDHLPPHKYIKNTPTCGTTPTEHLLNAGRRPQTSQKARKSPRTWVGQKKKQRQKNRDGGFPGGAVIKNPPAKPEDTGLSPGPGRSHMPWSN